MKKLGHLSKTLGAAICALQLAGCVTTSETEDWRQYSSRIEAGDKGQVLEGRRFWTFYSRNPSGREPSTLVNEALIAEFESQGRAHGFIPVENPGDADFIFVFTPTYMNIGIQRSEFEYEGGETERVYVDREVERYDQYGNFIGYDRVHDVEYRRTPRRATGIRTFTDNIVGPIIIAHAIDVDTYDPEFDYDNATESDIARIATSLVGATSSIPTFVSLGHCLVESLWDGFPEPQSERTHSFEDREACALPLPEDDPASATQ